MHPNEPNAPSRPRRLLALQRQRQAFQMRLAGATEYEIAKQLGVSQPAVSQMLTRARKDLTEEVRLDHEEYRSIQLQDIFQTLALLRGIIMPRRDAEGRPLPQDVGAQLAAIDRLNRLHERLARLEGLDAPVKTDIMSGGKPFEGIVRVIEHDDGKHGDGAT